MPGSQKDGDTLRQAHEGGVEKRDARGNRRQRSWGDRVSHRPLMRRAGGLAHA